MGNLYKIMFRLKSLINFRIGLRHNAEYYPWGVVKLMIRGVVKLVFELIFPTKIGGFQYLISQCTNIMLS